MTRLSRAALVPLALAATTVLLGACGDDSTSGTAGVATDRLRPGAHTEAEPIEMINIGAGTALEPATYAMPLIGPDSPIRAIVDVPDGYFSAGGWVIDDGHGTLVPDEFGNLDFWSAVSKVDPDPCHAGPLHRVGTGVRALARALVSQPGRVTSRPEPVTVGRHHGLYVESRASGALSRCDRGEHELFRAGHSSWMRLVDAMPGTTDRLWILNVGGHRVIAAVQTMQGRTADPAELVDIARSARFDLGGSYYTRSFRPGP
jgi:hypothetical protein